MFERLFVEKYGFSKKMFLKIKCMFVLFGVFVLPPLTDDSSTSNTETHFRVEPDWSSRGVSENSKSIIWNAVWLHADQWYNIERLRSCGLHRKDRQRLSYAVNVCFGLHIDVFSASMGSNVIFCVYEHAWNIYVFLVIDISETNLSGGRQIPNEANNVN